MCFVGTAEAHSSVPLSLVATNTVCDASLILRTVERGASSKTPISNLHILFKNCLKTVVRSEREGERALAPPPPFRVVLSSQERIAQDFVGFLDAMKSRWSIVV